MLDVRLFKIRAFGVSSLTLTLVFFALMGSFFSMALLLQLVYGYSPVNSAVRLLPVSLIMMTASPWSTKLVARSGKRAVVTAGMASLALGMALMATLSTHSSYWHLLIAIGFAAGGMSLAMSPTTDLLMSAVPRERAGMGSAMNDTTRELGGALGVAVFGSLLASIYGSKLGPALTGLSPEARSSAHASLSGALAQADATGGAAGGVLADAAKSAWMHGFTVSMTIAAVIVAAAALLAWAALPDAAHDHQPMNSVDAEAEALERAAEPAVAPAATLAEL
ncbi:MAG: transporter [Acidimicrobiia bacterium]|nr:transporter [Acidimicrobiia bacterium]